MNTTPTNDGGPAFPTVSASVHLPHHGMSLRAYAAIKLRVPESGIDWLDDMIRKSQADWLAGMALQGMIANPAIGFSMSAEAMSLAALSQADAMLAARNHEPPQP